MYIVETCYTDRNEWSNPIEYYQDALEFALAKSELAGVSETRVYHNDDIIEICVDGNYAEPVDFDDIDADDLYEELFNDIDNAIEGL